MAIIQPYGDPSAHGQLNRSIVFRRRGKHVVMSGINRPKKSSSPNQIIQRNKFLPGQDAYKILYSESKYFYRQRGIQLSMSGVNLFMKKYLTNELPSTGFGKDIKSVSQMAIYTPAGDEADSIKIDLEFLDDGAPSYDSYGFVEDNANIYTKVNDAVDPVRQRLKIYYTGAIAAVIPFRYVVNIHWMDQALNEFEYLMRLPKIELGPAEGIYLYLATDWSLYWDDTMRRLACTPQF